MRKFRIFISAFVILVQFTFAMVAYAEPTPSVSPAATAQTTGTVTAGETGTTTDNAETVSQENVAENSAETAVIQDNTADTESEELTTAGDIEQPKGKVNVWMIISITELVIILAAVAVVIIGLRRGNMKLITSNHPGTTRPGDYNRLKTEESNVAVSSSSSDVQIELLEKFAAEKIKEYNISVNDKYEQASTVTKIDGIFKYIIKHISDDNSNIELKEKYIELKEKYIELKEIYIELENRYNDVVNKYNELGKKYNSVRLDNDKLSRNADTQAVIAQEFQVPVNEPPVVEKPKEYCGIQIKDNSVQLTEGQYVYIERKENGNVIEVYPTDKVVNSSIRAGIYMPFFDFTVNGSSGFTVVEPCILNKTAFNYIIEKKGKVVIN